MNAVQKWFEANGSAAQTNGGFQLLAAVSLLVFAAVAASTLRSIGRPTQASIAGLSGAVSAGLLIVGTAAISSLGTDASSNAAVDQAMYQIGFFTAGALHIATLGLLIVAIASGLSGLLPKWLSISGIVIGVIGLLATLTGLVDALAAATFPGRYLGFVWLLIVSIMLAVKRAPAGARTAPTSASV